MKAEQLGDSQTSRPPPQQAPKTAEMRGARGFHYLPQLDGLRALAVAAVAAAHAEVPFASGGGIGVDVFFVLSGYLITTLLLQEFDATGTVSMRTFYIRRARRLLPALLAVAAFSFVAFAVVRPVETDDTLLGILVSVFYVSSWFRALGISDLGWFGHTWSLSVEEHFYILWPPLALFMMRRGVPSLRRWIVVLLGVTVAYQLAVAVSGAPSARINGIDMRAGQLLAGCGLAVLLMGGAVVRSPRWTALWRMLVVLSVVDLARTVAYPYSFGVGFLQNAAISVVALESAIIIGYLVVHARGTLSRVLSHPALVWTGRRSYAIYLWHLPLIGLLSFKGHPMPVRVAGRGTAAVLTIVAAWASFKWIESPFYRRRVEQPAATPEGAPPPGETGDRPATAPVGRRST